MLSTGRVIANYLDTNGFSIEDLSRSAGVSTRTIYRMLFGGESKLSFEVASAVHDLIPEIGVEFLMTYDAKYRLQLQELAREWGVKDVNVVLKRYKADKLYRSDRFDGLELAKKIALIFGLENIRNDCAINVDNLSLNYSKANQADEEASLLWVKAAYEECKQSCDPLLIYNEGELQRIFERIKEYSDTSSLASTIFNLKVITAMCGINFYYRPSIPNSRVKAVLVKDENGSVFLLMSDLFKCIENLWLSFVHEMIHARRKDFDSMIGKSGADITENENYVGEEVLRYFVGKSIDKYSACTLENVTSLAEETHCPIGISAELLRFKTSKYGVPEVNKLVHYYRQKELENLICSD